MMAKKRIKSHTKKSKRKKRLTIEQLAKQMVRYNRQMMGLQYTIKNIDPTPINRAAGFLADQAQRLHNLQLGSRVANLDTMIAGIGIRIERIEQALIQALSVKRGRRYKRARRDTTSRT